MERARGVVLEDGVARRFFQQNITAEQAKSKDTLWPYRGLSMKHAGLLAELMPHRQALADASEATMGRLLLQKPFERQAQSFLHNVGSNISQDDIAICAFRFRMVPEGSERFRMVPSGSE